MYCFNCGRNLEDQARFCSECGAPRHAPQPAAAGNVYEEHPFSRVRDGKVAGVCGGVARYLHMDVTLVRVLWLLAAIFPPVPGIIAYIVCWAVMPIDPLPTPAPANSSTNAAAALPQHP
jgi:phage shock protein C